MTKIGYKTKLLSIFSEHGVMLKMMVRSIAMLTLSLITVEYVSYHLTSKQIVKMTEQQQAAVTNVYVERIAQILNALQSDLKTLATAPSLTDYHKNRSYHLLEEANENLKTSTEIFSKLQSHTPGYLRLRFAYKNGDDLIHLSPYGNNQVIPLRLYPLDHSQHGTETSFVGLIPEPGSLSDDYSIVFRSDVLAPNRDLIGMIETGFSLNRLLEQLKNEKVFETGHLAVFSSAGDVIYFPGKKVMEPALSIHPNMKDLIDQIKNQTSGNIRLNLDVAYEVKFSQIPNLRWYVLSFAPVNEMFATLNKIRNIVLIIVIFNILIEILFLAYFVQKVILSPVNAILRVAQRILSGDRQARVVIKSRDEIAILAQSFNEMTESLDKNFREIKAWNATLDAKIEERTRDLKNAQFQLIETNKMAALGEMAGGVAHEINNPLAIIQILTGQLQELIEDNPLDIALIKKMVSQMESTTLRIGKIVQAMRSFSRDGSKDPRLPVNVQQLLDETLGLCEERFKSNGTQVVVEKARGDLVFYGRATEISQVLLNLLNNAYDAISSQNEKWIKISVLDEPEWIEIRIMDSGSGISPELQSKIFQPFFTSKEINKGTGLGLSISLGIIQSHGGILELDSQSSNTCFRVRLPKKENPTLS